jgi:hypothetical protein
MQFSYTTGDRWLDREVTKKKGRAQGQAHAKALAALAIEVGQPERLLDWLQRGLTLAQAKAEVQPNGATGGTGTSSAQDAALRRALREVDPARLWATAFDAARAIRLSARRVIHRSQRLSRSNPMRRVLVGAKMPCGPFGVWGSWLMRGSREARRRQRVNLKPVSSLSCQLGRNRSRWS